MEKVKITAEQEESIKTWAFDGNELRNHIANFIYVRNMGGLTIRPELFWLNNVTVEDFAKILCGWYEVKQPFEVGDWVYNLECDKYRKVINVTNGICEVKKDSSDFSGTTNVNIVNFHKWSKVTEPWKIMLLELGREKPRFHEDDVIVTESKIRLADWMTHDETVELFELGIVTDFHPYETSIKVKQQ